MKKYYISMLMIAVIAFVAGIAYVGVPHIFGAALQNPGSKFVNSFENKTLLNASSTAGNSSRHATSSPIQIGGAKKVVFQFAVKGTTTVSSADFFVYVSPLDITPDRQSSSESITHYRRFTDFVEINGTSPTTADTYFARVGATGSTVTPVANGSATTTVAMDLSFGTWRSMLCTASSTRHDPATCTALIEY